MVALNAVFMIVQPSAGTLLARRGTKVAIAPADGDGAGQDQATACQMWSRKQYLESRRRAPNGGLRRGAFTMVAARPQGGP